MTNFNLLCSLLSQKFNFHIISSCSHNFVNYFVYFKSQKCLRVIGIKYKCFKLGRLPTCIIFFMGDMVLAP